MVPINKSRLLYLIHSLLLSIQILLIMFVLQALQRKNCLSKCDHLSVLNSTEPSNKVIKEANYHQKNTFEYLPGSDHQDTSQNSPNSSSLEPFLVIMIFSKPAVSNLRNTCRNTWLKDYRDSTEVVHWFVIGTAGVNEEEKWKLQTESEQYGDILLLENHTESYGHQCTNKLLLSFHWVANHSKAQYVMKTDDDCYVRLPLILPQLHKRTMQTKRPFLYGSISWYHKPQTENKWMEKNWNLTKEYLPFPYGSGYILPVLIVKSIVHSNNIVPLRKLQNEDVTVGLWVATYNIDYIDMKRHNGGMNQFSCPHGLDSTFIYHCWQSSKLLYNLHKCSQRFRVADKKRNQNPRLVK